MPLLSIRVMYLTKKVIERAICTPSLSGCECQHSQLIASQTTQLRLITEIMIGFRPCMLKERFHLKFKELRNVLFRPLWMDKLAREQAYEVPPKIAELPFRGWY